MGGEFDYIDFCNAEEFSLSSFGLFAKLLGYKDHLGFYYLLPKTSLRDGLVFILTEGDVQRMKDIALANGEIDIYVVETSHGDSQINKNIDENTDKHTESDQEESSYEDKSLHDTDYDQSEDDVLEVESPNGNLNKTEKNQINMNYEDEEIYVSDIDDKSSSYDLHSIHSEDEEQPPYRFNTQTDMEKPQFKVGMIFTNALEFKEAVKQHAITWQRDIKFLKNDKLRVRAKCNGNNYPWVVLASKVRNSTNFQIKTLNITHNCGRTLSKHRFVNSKLLSKKYMNDWRLHDGWKMGDFQEKVQNDLNVEVSRAQYYRTKNKVHNLLYGNYKDQYKRLYDYCEELRVSNPSSTVVLKTSMDEVAGEERFERLYICFEACKSGFLEGCRPIIGLDGCHLKGPHKGILLSAVGIDPNNSIFPLCYCVVETEDKNSWKWFLEILQQDIAIYFSIESYLKDYVHSCYSIESYLKAYGFIINPIKGQEEWPKTRKGPVAPNQELRLPGRPKKSRKKESNEKATSREKIMKLSKVGQKTLSCTNCKQEGHNKRKCPNTPLTSSSTSSVPPFVEATPLAQVPPQRQATPLAQVEPRKKKRCSVCLKEGHYRNTCPTATGRMWQNMDFYGYNCQKNPTRVPSVARNLNAPSSIGMNEIGEIEMSALAPSMSSFTVSNPPTPSGTSISVHEPAQGLNLGGVSMKANFKKGGKNCVTLSTLEYAARSRMLKESNARDIGHLSQQSSTAK